MRTSEWVLVAVVYFCAAVAGASVAYATQLDPGLAFLVAALLAVQLAAWLYHRHDATAPPFGFRLLIGMLLAVLCGVVAVAAQWRWKLVALPEVVIPIDAIGTLFVSVIGVIPSISVTLII